jgi:hypothetical protein
MNRPLLYFPRVKIIDVFVARGLLETANGMAVAGVVSCSCSSPPASSSRAIQPESLGAPAGDLRRDRVRRL